MRKMKKASPVVVAVALLASAGCNHEKQEMAKPSAPVINIPVPKASADVPFEGEIDLTVYAPSSKAPTSIAYDIRGDKIRSSSAGGGTTPPFVVSDLKSQKVYLVDDASKSITTIDASVPVGQANAKTAPPLTKTGKMEKVSGHECEDWSVVDGGERFDMCVTKGVAYFDLTTPSTTGGEPIWAAILTKERAFPLRVIATDKAGKQEFRAEATKVESRKLDDALFNVPSAYHTVDASHSVKIPSVP